MKLNIIDLLSEGEENAITTGQICNITGLTKREVTLYINALRRNGEVICSSDKGYFCPSCLCEVERFYRQMTSRQREIEKAKQSAKDYIRKYGGKVD